MEKKFGMIRIDIENWLWKSEFRYLHGQISNRPLICQRPFTVRKCYLLVMSPSWNFPAWAEPSYKGSEPSRAWASQFPSWKRAGDFYRFIAFLAQFFLACSRCIAFLAQFFCLASEPEKSNLFKKEKYYSLQRKVKIKCQFFQNWEGQKKAFRAEKNPSELKEKRPRAKPSRAENPSARLGLMTTA